MALAQNIKNRAIRVAFLTNDIFQKENEASGGALKKRALRVVSRNLRYPVVESSDKPDIVFYVIRQPGSRSWMLRTEKRGD